MKTNTKKTSTSRKKLLPIALLFLIAVSLGVSLNTPKSSSGLSTTTAQAGTSTEPAIVATVEGKQISAKIYRMYLKNGIEAFGLSDKTAEGRRQIELLKEGIIADLIDRALIEAEARRRGISVSEEAFNSAYKSRVAEMGGESYYRTYLAEHNLADEEFRQTIAQEIYGKLIEEELGYEVSVATDETKAFYEKERGGPNLAGLFVEPERVRASHILVAARRSQIAADLWSKRDLNKTELDRLVAEEMNKKREYAATILKKVKAGADFARLAREHSADPATRDRGGDLGLFTRATHTAKFDDAAFALRPGQTSDIVETEYGFHIIKVTEHRPQRTKNFDEVSRAVEQHLLARKRAAHLSQWLDERRREADVRLGAFYRVGQFQSGAKQQN